MDDINITAKDAVLPESINNEIKSSRKLRRSKPSPLALEQRMMFDGAAVTTAAAVIDHATTDATNSSTETTVESNETTGENTAAPVIAQETVTDSSGIASLNYTLIPSATVPLANSDVLRTALADIDAAIKSLVNSGDYTNVMSEIFGRAGTDAAQFSAALESLHDLLATSGLSISFELRSADEMQGHPAAYAAVSADGTERIYVNGEWLATADAASIKNVLLEELGHAIDQRLNAGVDSVGDEGELFADRLDNEQLTQQELSRVTTENDSGVLSIDGHDVNVEFAFGTVAKTDRAYTEGGSATSSLFTYSNGTVVNNGNSFSIEVTNVTAGDRLTIGNTEFNITATATAATATTSVASAAIALSSTTATITVSKIGGGNWTLLEAKTLVESITYRSLSDNPTATASTRTITVGGAAATVTITAVNDAPTLTTFTSVVATGGLTGSVAVTMVDLNAHGDEADVDGTVTAFVVTSLNSAGTLLIGSSFDTATAWASGTNDIIDATHNAYWTGSTGTSGTYDAFSVKAKDDGGLLSTTSVQVQLARTDSNFAPTLTAMAGSVVTVAEDTEATISYDDLAAQGDEYDTNDNLVSFVVTEVTSGTLYIGSSRDTATPWNASTNYAINAGHNAYWMPGADANGTLSAFKVKVRDSAVAESATAVPVTVLVTAVNDAPTRTSGSLTAISVAEDSANSAATRLGLTGVTYGVGGGSDESGQVLTYTVTAIPDFITLYKADGTTLVTASTTLTLAELQGLKYKTVADANGSGNITWTVTDDGTTNSVSDPKTLTESLSISVSSVNDAPVNSVPSDQSVATSGTLTFSSANSNLISISDVDAASGLVQVTLSVNSGTLSLSGITGLSFTSGGGVDDGSMTFTGTVEDINAALAGMTFTSNTLGSATLTITTNDQGNTGGDALSDTDTVAINVTEPIKASISSVTVTEGTGGTNSAVFTITLSRAIEGSGTVKIYYEINDGTASSADYTYSGLDSDEDGYYVEFSSLETSKTITIGIVTDSIYENPETFYVALTKASVDTGSGYADSVTLANGGKPLTSGNSVTGSLTLSSDVSALVTAGSNGYITMVTDFQQSPFAKDGSVPDGEETFVEQEVTTTVLVGDKLFLLTYPLDPATWTKNADTGQLEYNVDLSTAYELQLTVGSTLLDSNAELLDAINNSSALSDWAAGDPGVTGNITGLSLMDYLAYLGSTYGESGVEWIFTYDDNNGGNKQARYYSFNIRFDAPENNVLIDATGTGTGLIIDDDMPTLTVTAPEYDVSEGSYAVFTVNLSNPAAADTPITLELSHGDNGAGDAETGDYEALSDADVYYFVGEEKVYLSTDLNGDYIVPAGVTEFFVSVETTSDDVYEGAEDFTLTATFADPVLRFVNGVVDDLTTVDDESGGSREGASDSDVATIIDDGTGIVYDGSGNNVNDGKTPDSPGYTAPDDDRPTLTVEGVDVEEGSSATFTVTLNNALEDSTAIALSLSHGADAGDAEDGDYEALLSDAYVYYMGDTDSEEPGVQLGEIELAIVDGKYIVPAGVTEFFVRVDTINDDVYEGAEDFTLTATFDAAALKFVDGVSGNTRTGYTANANSTIYDDGSQEDGDDENETSDDDRPTLTVEGVDVEEGSSATFTVTLNNALEDSTAIALSLSHGADAGDAEDGDYEALLSDAYVYYMGDTDSEEPGVQLGEIELAIVDGKYIVPAGVTEFFVRVDTINDDVYEGAEDFTLTATFDAAALKFVDGVSGNTRTGYTANANSTIYDDGSQEDGDDENETSDDDRPTLTVEGVDVEEGSSATFTVTLNNALEDSTAIALSLSHGADAGDAEDGDYEALLSDAYVYYMGDTDSEEPGVQLGEIELAIVDGKYIVPAGVTEFFVRVDTINDDVYEGAEDFTLTATFDAAALKFVDGVSGNTRTGYTANANSTIYDDGSQEDGDDENETSDDDRPTLTVEGVDVEEGSSATFTVTLNNALEDSTAIALSLSHGADAGDAEDGDYEALLSDAYVYYMGDTDSEEPGVQLGEIELAIVDGKYIVPAGVTEFFVRVDTINDDVYEGAEDFTLTATFDAAALKFVDGVSGNTRTGYTANANSTIYDDGSQEDGDDENETSDDDRPTLTVEGVDVEEGSSATFTVTLNNALEDSTAIALSLSHGADAGDAEDGDYEALLSDAYVYYMGDTDSEEPGVQLGEIELAIVDGKYIVPAGVTEFFVRVDTINDDVYEGAEDFTLTATFDAAALKFVDGVSGNTRTGYTANANSTIYDDGSQEDGDDENETSDDDRDIDGIPNEVEDALANQAGGDDDLNDDEIPDYLQNAVTILAWHTEEIHTSAIDDPENFNEVQAIISVEVKDSGDPENNPYKLVQVDVLDPSAAYDENDPYSYVGGGKPATINGEDVFAPWDPLRFEIVPNSGELLSDYDGNAENGIQVVVYIDISRSDLPADYFTNYLKYVSDAVLEANNGSIMGLDGLITEAGWYDFTRRIDPDTVLYAGDGAEFIIDGDKLVGIRITFTDNAFGDFDPAANVILDPGLPTRIGGEEIKPLPPREIKVLEPRHYDIDPIQVGVTGPDAQFIYGTDLRVAVAGDRDGSQRWFRTSLDDDAINCDVATPLWDSLESSMDGKLTSNSDQAFRVLVAECDAHTLAVFRGVQDQNFEQNGDLQFAIAPDAFVHTDLKAIVKLQATLVSGKALPDWLVFNSKTGTFSGKAPAMAPDVLAVRVIARDQNGREAVVVFRINLRDKHMQASAGRSGFGDQMRMASRDMLGKRMAANTVANHVGVI